MLFRSTVSQLFASVSPTVWTRHVVGTAVRMHRVLTYCAFHDVLVLLDMFLAPAAEIAVDLWARPLIPVWLIMAWVKEEIAILAMLSYDSWY